MKIIITESQFLKLINENVDDILDKLYGGGKLTSSEKRKLDMYSKHLDSGGKESDFEYDEYPEEHESRGKNFKTMIGGKELIFNFDEKEMMGDEIAYYGEIIYDGENFIGGIYADKNGYLTDFDFYDSLDEENRLQIILKKFKYELENFFQENVIPNLN